MWLAGVGLDYIVEVREYAIWDWLYIFDNKDIAQNYAIDQNNIIIYGKDEHIWIFNSSGARSKTGDLGLPYLISKRNNIGVFISEDKRETIIADIVTG